MSEESFLRVAAQLSERTLAGDVAGVGELYRDDAVVWRNFDERELSKAQTLKVIGLLGQLPRLEYQDVRVRALPNGFVQQHVMLAETADGAAARVPACLVATVVEGRIARLDEYLDSAALAPLLGPRRG